MINWLPSIPIAGRVQIPGVFESGTVLVSVTSTVASIWRRAGYLRIEVLFEGEYFTVGYRPIEFGQSLVEIPVNSYRLSFDPVRDLTTLYPNTAIKIYPLTLSEYQSIMPLNSPMPVSIGQIPILDSLPTTFSAPPFAVATLPAAYQALAANPARQNFAVTITGAATVFLDLDAPTAANKRYQSIPPNGTYTGDFNYVGALFLWSTTGAAQACEIRELI